MDVWQYIIVLNDNFILPGNDLKQNPIPYSLSHCKFPSMGILCIIKYGFVLKSKEMPDNNLFAP
jgi:hypothetical protein